MKSEIDFKKQGKLNRASGKRFENFVRKDLELKGWVVDKWTNNIGMWGKDFNQIIKKGGKYIIQKTKEEVNFEDIIFDKIVPAKHKFRGMGIPMAFGTGMPDFVCIRLGDDTSLYEVIGVESKINGYLDKEEKEKCNWYLQHKIFSQILIAKKIKEGRKVVVEYKEFKNESI